MSRYHILASILAIAALALSTGTAYSQQVTISYGTATTEANRKSLTQMRASEDPLGVSGLIPNELKARVRVHFVFTECKSVNAFYVPDKKAIIVCLELIQAAENIATAFAKSKYADALSTSGITAMSGIIEFILQHELGHLYVHQLNLPVLGREEDAADQIAAFFLLHKRRDNFLWFSGDAIVGPILLFEPSTSQYKRSDFSDEHSLDPQRQSNLVCWAFGKEPERYKYLEPLKIVSDARRGRCTSEYQQLETSVLRLLRLTARPQDCGANLAFNCVEKK